MGRKDDAHRKLPLVRPMSQVDPGETVRVDPARCGTWIGGGRGVLRAALPP
jgi:hypothetical protein